MKDVLSILEELKANSSSLKKLEILNEHKDNKELETVVYKALNPFTNYWIKKIPEYEPLSNMGKYHPETLTWAMKNLSNLTNRTYTGHAGIEYLQCIFERLSQRDGQVLERIIKRDLKCGVQTSTANKVWKNLVPKFELMLASRSDKKLLDKMEFPQIVEDKEDGMRVTVMVTQGSSMNSEKTSFFTRNGKAIEIFDNMQEAFIQMADGIDVVFDGEMLVRVDGKILDRKTGNGILNKAIKGTITPEEAGQIVIRLWDMIPYNDFQYGKCSRLESVRYANLKLAFTHMTPFIREQENKVHMLNQVIVNDLGEMNELFRKALAAGKEGIIVKNPKGTWEAKRSKHWMKMKAEEELDLKVVGWNEGTGRLAGKLGALTVQNADGTLEVNVGTGFSDEQRSSITPENSIGKIAAIKYNERIKARNTEVERLFLPVFVEFRVDKDKVDL